MITLWVAEEVYLVNTGLKKLLQASDNWLGVKFEEELVTYSNTEQIKTAIKNNTNASFKYFFFTVKNYWGMVFNL